MTPAHHPVPVVTEGAQHRQRWLVARRQGVGASEISAVLGISPYESRFSLYWRKKFGGDLQVTDQMEWGSRHEPAIAAKFAENHADLYIEDPCDTLWQHPTMPWMLATPDRLIWNPAEDADELTAIVQIKTARSFDEGWGEPGTDHIPAHYRAQVTQEMAVMGVTRCYLPVLAGGYSYREYVVDLDPSDLATIIVVGKQFMSDVDQDIQPDIDGSEATARTLKALHPSVIDQAVPIPEEMMTQFRAAEDAAVAADKALATAKNRILARLGSARTAMYDGQPIARRHVFDAKHLDTAALRRDHPELVAAYQTTSTRNFLRSVRKANN